MEWFGEFEEPVASGGLVDVEGFGASEDSYAFMLDGIGGIEERVVSGGLV